MLVPVPFNLSQFSFLTELQEGMTPGFKSILSRRFPKDPLLRRETFFKPLSLNPAPCRC